jgi:methionyl-tRNA formyltransferase|tara:strand:- start:661 stop:1584 length:924 start_codon:yes stop_codon:yes gene_type:complete
MLHKKVVFMGTPEFSVPLLEILAKSFYKITCVYTQAPKKSNRGQKINISPVHKCAENLNLIVRNPTTLNSEEEFDFIKKLEPDIVLVVAYGQLIPKNFLNIPKKGFINIHASLLPKWRGAAPIQRSIMSLDSETGISIMQIVEDLDSGPVMKQLKVKIGELSTSKDISNILSKISTEIIVDTLDEIFNQKIEFTEQNHASATYANKIKKSEGKINWAESAKNILAKINGLNPEPGAWFEYKSTRYKVWRARIFKKKGSPGTILNSNFIIGCGDKSLEIIEIQKEGKNRLLLKNFLTGINFKQGDELK